MAWTLNDIPDQTGKVAIVTGSNTGIGYEMARHLAKHGAHVFMATRSEEKGNAAVKKLRAELGKGADVEFLKLDLASSSSIREFADAFLARQLPLHILINNAGVAMIPQSKTADGYETVVGVNHLGTFLLTNLLLEVLKKSAPARVVSVSSLIAHNAKVNLDYIKEEDKTKKYNQMERYGSSKLYNVMFSRELEKRLQGTGVHSYVCQPGVANTDIINKVDQKPLFNKTMKVLAPVLGQSAEKGAISALYCATAPEVEKLGPDKFYGPRMMANLGNTRAATFNHKEVNPAMNSLLWEKSERITQLV